jgi:three-Cys-motif partner protein
VVKFMIPEGPAADDGRPTRPANPATIDKLAIVRAYLQAFAIACSNNQPFFFIDGFAGPGIDRVKTSGELLWGSPLIAAQSRPSFAKILAVDLDPAVVEVLRERVAPFGNVVVERGDANVDLVDLMGKHIPTTRPATCLLDPAKMNLQMDTIRRVATFRTIPGRLTELLVLFPTAMTLWRMMPTDGRPPMAEATIDALFGTEEWRAVWARWEGTVTTNRGELYNPLRELYLEQFRRLGYPFVDTREIRAGGQHGPLRYELVFASTNATGASIGSWCFANTYRTKRNLRLFDP